MLTDLAGTTCNRMSTDTAVALASHHGCVVVQPDVWVQAGKKKYQATVPNWLLVIKAWST
eukprot:3269680-Amphidinium_carterae.2